MGPDDSLSPDDLDGHDDLLGHNKKIAALSLSGKESQLRSLSREQGNQFFTSYQILSGPLYRLSSIPKAVTPQKKQLQGTTQLSDSHRHLSYTSCYHALPKPEETHVLPHHRLSEKTVLQLF